MDFFIFLTTFLDSSFHRIVIKYYTIQVLTKFLQIMDKKSGWVKNPIAYLNIKLLILFCISPK